MTMTDMSKFLSSPNLCFSVFKICFVEEIKCLTCVSPQCRYTDRISLVSSNALLCPEFLVNWQFFLRLDQIQFGLFFRKTSAGSVCSQPEPQNACCLQTAEGSSCRCSGPLPVNPSGFARWWSSISIIFSSFINWSISKKRSIPHLQFEYPVVHFG